MSEITNLDKDHVLILPSEDKMKDAISLYSEVSNYYIEYMHWNNRGILDGFIDHYKNMYLLNDEHDTRKNICDKLFDIYKTDDFYWSNQSFTSIATSLFKQLNGFLPKSEYSIYTIHMLDEYYPRAIQWCTFEKNTK